MQTPHSLAYGSTCGWPSPVAPVHFDELALIAEAFAVIAAVEPVPWLKAATLAA